MITRKSKKGQTDVQLHWIFILIAGGIILAFFVSLAVWYQGQQETKLENTIVGKLQTLFTTARESPRTAKPLQIPEMTLTFTCDPNGCSEYGCASEFSGGGVSKSTEAEVIFSPKILQGSFLVTWSLPWLVPFPVTNFLYVTNDKIRYLVIYDDNDSQAEQLATAVNDELQQNSYLNKQFISLSELSSVENYQDVHVRAVLFSNALPSSTVRETLTTIYGSAYDLIVITGTVHEGTITFFSGDTDEKVEYFELPLLIGGIFSPSQAEYRCNLHKALFRLKVVATNYKNTLSFYQENLPLEKGYCSVNYYQPLVAESLITMLDAAESALADEETRINAQLFADVITALNEVNQNLVIKDCPRVY